MMKYRSGKIFKREREKRLKRLERLKKGNNLDPLIRTEANKQLGGTVFHSHHRNVNKNLGISSIERLNLEREKRKRERLERLNLTASIKEYKGTKLNETANFEFHKKSKGHNFIVYNSKTMTYNTFLKKAKVDTEIASFIRFLQASMIRDGYQDTDLLKYLEDIYSGNDSKTDIIKTNNNGNPKFKPTPDSPKYLERKEKEEENKKYDEREIKIKNANRSKPSIKGFATNPGNKPTGDPEQRRSNRKGIYSR